MCCVVVQSSASSMYVAIKPDKHSGDMFIYVGVCCNQRRQLSGFTSVCDSSERFYGLENGF